MHLLEGLTVCIGRRRSEVWRNWRCFLNSRDDRRALDPTGLVLGVAKDGAEDQTLGEALRLELEQSIDCPACCQSQAAGAGGPVRPELSSSSRARGRASASHRALGDGPCRGDATMEEIRNSPRSSIRSTGIAIASARTAITLAVAEEASPQRDGDRDQGSDGQANDPIAARSRSRCSALMSATASPAPPAALRRNSGPTVGTSLMKSTYCSKCTPAITATSPAASRPRADLSRTERTSQSP